MLVVSDGLLTTVVTISKLAAVLPWPLYTLFTHMLVAMSSVHFN